LKTAFRKGFTLIELLIVIAILGVLAVVILVAINPQEQLARTRDAGRTSTITQLGHAMQAYGASHEGNYIAASTSWITDLVGAGEIAVVPGGLAYQVNTQSCNSTTTENDFCYISAGTPPTAFVLYTTLESGSNYSRCVGGGAYGGSGDTVPAVAFDSTQGRGGIVCTNGEITAAGVSFEN
jgi:prepilin-type N-terminal cleavage/methylation domain-containing protein